MRRMGMQWKRAVSMVLVLAMLLSTLPAAAFGAFGEEEEGAVTAVEREIGPVKLAAASFAAPAKSVGGAGFQLKDGGGGSLAAVQVSDAVWNSASDSGVQFYYTLADSAGQTFTNNDFAENPLPGEFGKVYYCYVYYIEDPAYAGKGFDNLVPVEISAAAWENILKGANTDGVVDPDAVMENLPWVDASKTTMPLATRLSVSATGSTEMAPEAHYYSALVKWQMDGADPVVSTGNGVVYIHEASIAGGGAGGTGGDGVDPIGGGGGTGGGGGGAIGGDGGGGGGGGAGGEGGGGAGFVAPPVDIDAFPGRWTNGLGMNGLTIFDDLEVLHLSDDPDVTFFYRVKDANGDTYGTLPTDSKYYYPAYGEIQYVYVYSDTDPKDDPLRAFTPYGMTHDEWLGMIDDYEAEHAKPGEPTDYAGLLSTLSWVSADDTKLTPYASVDPGAPGGPLPAATYSDRYYSVFARWVKGGSVFYDTSNRHIYLYEKEEEITTPITSAVAIPYLLNTAGSGRMDAGYPHIVYRPATETGIEFRYTFTDASGVVYTSATDGESPYNLPKTATVEYLWTYADTEGRAGYDNMVPVGMKAEDYDVEWSAFVDGWRATHGRGEETDYNEFELLQSISGWTTDPTLPLFDNATVYGTPDKGVGVYESRYYNCIVRVTVNDGSGYRRIFMNNGSYHYAWVKVGDAGKLNVPANIKKLKLMYYNYGEQNHCWDTAWKVMSYSELDDYTDYVVTYDILDNIGQPYAGDDSAVPDLPSNAHFEYLWTRVPWTYVSGNPDIFYFTHSPGFAEQIPMLYTDEEWAELTAGKTESEIQAFLAALPDWTEDNRLPTYMGREYYFFFARLIVDGAVYRYFWDPLDATSCCVPCSQSRIPRSTSIQDHVYSIDDRTEPLTYTFEYKIGSGASGISYQWYEANGKASDGLPLPGETSYKLSLSIDPQTPMAKYYYCVATFHGAKNVVHTLRSRSGLVLVTHAPVGSVNAYHGIDSYAFDPPDFERVNHDFVSDFRHYGTERSGVYYSAEWCYYCDQIVGSKTTLTGSWVVTAGECAYMTWQWFVSDDLDELGEPAGVLHTVWNPYEEGFTQTDVNKKCDIRLDCPSDELGTKYYRVVCTNYDINGEFFACTSEILQVNTLAEDARDTLFEVDENGRLLRYLGFEDEVVVPAEVGGVAVTAVAGSFNGIGARRVVLPEGLTDIEDQAFYSCIGLEEIELPSTLLRIGEKAFERCGLRRLVIPAGVESIGFAAFRYAFTPESKVVIRCGSGCAIEKGAFYGAYMHTVIFDGDSFPELDAGAIRYEPHTDKNDTFKTTFEQLPWLKRISFAEGVPITLTTFPFSYCQRLTWIDNLSAFTTRPRISLSYGRMGPVAAYYERIDTELFRVGNYICSIDKPSDYPQLNEHTAVETARIEKILDFDGDTLVIPETVGDYQVTGVGMTAGYGERDFVSDHRLPSQGYGLTDDVTKLRALTLPTGLRHIAAGVFRFCDLYEANLNELTNLRYIGKRAFYGQEHLTASLTLPACMVMDEAFYRCLRLSELHLNGTILYGDAFSYCISLKTVDGSWTPSLYSSYFSGGGQYFTRYFYLAPAFPNTKVYTHYYRYSTVQEENPASFDYRVDLDVDLSASSGAQYWGSLAIAQASFRQYITGNYVYRGTPEEAYIFYYLGLDDTEVVFPAEIYNEQLDKTFKIRGVLCREEFIDHPYTVTVEEGIETMTRSFVLDETVDNVDGSVYFFNPDGTVAQRSVPKFSGIGIDGPEEVDCSKLLYANIEMGLDSVENSQYSYNFYNTDAARFPHATKVTLPDSIRDGANFFGSTEETEIAMPSGLAKLSGGYSDSPNLQRVTFPGTSLRYLNPRFDNCSNIQSVDYGLSPSIVSESALHIAPQARLSPNTEMIVPAFFFNDDVTDVEITLPSHSAITPIFDVSDGVSNNDDPEHFAFQNDLQPTIYCYEGSKTDVWAQMHYSPEQIQYLPETPYRLVEFFDAGTGEYIMVTRKHERILCNNIISNIKSIEWYDLTDGGKYVGCGKELQNGVVESHRYKAVVTYGDALVQDYYTDAAREIVFEPGESYKRVELGPRPEWYITAMMPDAWGNYVVVDTATNAILYQAEHHEDRTLTILPGIPGVDKIVRKPQSAIVYITVKASDELKLIFSSNDFEDYVVEHLSDPDGDGKIDLGTLVLTPRQSPETVYPVVGVLPDDSRVDPTVSGVSMYTGFYNLTTGQKIRGSFSKGRVSLYASEIRVGDQIRVTESSNYNAEIKRETYRYSWVDKTFTFTVTAEGDEAPELLIPVVENALVSVSYSDVENTDITPRSVFVGIYRDDGTRFLGGYSTVSLEQGKDVYLPDGSYTLVLFDKSLQLNAYSPDVGYRLYTDESYYIQDFIVAGREDRSFTVDSTDIPRDGKRRAEVAVVCDVSVDPDNLVGDYVPVTFRSTLTEKVYALRKDWSESVKTLVVTFTGSNDPAPFYEAEGKLVWFPIAYSGYFLSESCAYDAATGVGTLTVRYTGADANFTFYVPYKCLVSGYTVSLSCKGIPYYNGTVSVNGVGENEFITVTSLPECTSVETAQHSVTIRSDSLLMDEYVQIYADGALIEESPGCGYTQLIKKARSRSVAFDAVIKGVNTTTRYTVALCDSPDKRLIFPYGEPCEQDSGDYLYFEEQRVTYFADELFGPSPEKLAMRFIQFENGKPLLTNSCALYAFFDEGGHHIRNDPESGFYYSLAPRCMNPDGTFKYGPEYQFSLEMRHPDQVADGAVTMDVYMYSGEYFAVKLKYNEMTGTFDGSLSLDANTYTPEMLMESYSLRYAEDVSETASFAITENDPTFVESIDHLYAKLTDMGEGIEALKAEHPAVDMDVLEAVLEVFTEENAFGEDTAETVELLRIIATTENKYHDAVAELEAALDDAASGWPFASVGGAQETLAALTGILSGVSEANYSEAYLAANGYVPQSTENAGTVYICFVGGVAKLYYPAEGLEVEMDMSALDFPIEDTMSAALLGDAPMLGDAGVWAELSEDYSYLKALGDWSTDVLTAFKLCKEFLTAIINCLVLLGKTEQEFIEIAKPFVNEYNQKIMHAQQELNELGKKIAEKVEDIASIKKLESWMGNKITYYSEYFKPITGEQKLAELEAEHALLLQAEQETRARLVELETLENNLLQAGKQTEKIAKELSLFAKGKNALIGLVNKTINSIPLNIALTSYDLVVGCADLYNALVTTCQNVESNLNIVRVVWELQAGDVSEECRQACEQMRSYLASMRKDYMAKFYVSGGKFMLSIAGDVASLCGMAGKIGLVYSISSFALGEFADAVVTGVQLGLDKMIDKQWEVIYSNCGAKEEKDDDDKNHTPHKKHIDPSGFIYEAVASNRLEGVTVKAYYKDGDGNPALWDASDTEQLNPFVTGADGVYEWSTPSGEWLVTAEKDGYVQASSMGDPEAVDGWLPVPPPQMNVNIGMVSASAPEVASVQFSGSEIRVLFSQYMDIAALASHPAYVTVTKNGQPVNVDTAFIDSEASPKNESVFYGRTLYITPAAGFDFGGSVELTVSGDFTNYAGTAIGADYHSGVLAPSQIPASIEHSYPNRLVTDVGDHTAIAVRLLDTAGEPIANRAVRLDAMFDLYALPASAVTDENGRAVFEAVSLRSGSDVLTFTCEDASAALNVTVNPLGTEKPAKPTANLSDYALVEAGTKLVLSCATEGAVIRYTLDDTCPCDETALVYTAPITITGNTFIRVAAWTETGGYSERLNLHLLTDGVVSDADVTGDGVVDTEDVSGMLVDVLFHGASDTPDLNGDNAVNCLDALSPMLDGAIAAVKLFIAAAYDADGKLVRAWPITIGGAVSPGELDFLKSADNVRFFYLGENTKPAAASFAYPAAA